MNFEQIIKNEIVKKRDWCEKIGSNAFNTCLYCKKSINIRDFITIFDIDPDKNIIHNSKGHFMCIYINKNPKY